MTFRRLLAFAGWVAIVTWCWHNLVPFAATKTVPLPKYAISKSTLPSGLGVFNHQRFDAARNRWVECGPMEFWNLPQARKTHELFTADDEIIYGPLLQSREVMIRRAGRLLVVDSRSGDFLEDLPDVPGAREFRRAPEDRILVANQTDLFLFRIGEETPLWTLPMFSLKGQICGDLFIGSPRPAKSPTMFRFQATAINLETGQPDTRFDHLAPISNISLSPDGRFAVVWTKRPATATVPAPVGLLGAYTRVGSVCNATTGRVLYTLPKEVGSHPRFSLDGNEFHAAKYIPSRPTEFSRWRTADGVEIPYGSLAEQLKANGGLTQDGRFQLRYSSGSIEGTNTLRDSLLMTIGRINSVLARWKLRVYTPSNQIQRQVFDATSERVLGFFPAHSNIVLLDDNQGFTATTPVSMNYYALPPSRDWLWLALWSAFPPAGVFGLVSLVRRIRSRRAQPLPSPVNDHISSDRPL